MSVFMTDIEFTSSLSYIFILTITTMFNNEKQLSFNLTYFVDN